MRLSTSWSLLSGSRCSGPEWTIVMVFQVLALNDSPLALSTAATGLSLGLFAFSIFVGANVCASISGRRRSIGRSAPRTATSKT
jgi:hypothetical protein